MSHMIDSLAWTGDVPWHGLGRKLPQHATVDEMIRFGGLDWNVIPKPLFAGLDATTGAGVSVPGYKALVRSDRPETVLSIVSESYGIVQNAEALALAAAAVGTGSASAEVCGALDDGRRIFLVINVREAGFDVAGERVEPYVVCYAGHDGSTSVGFRFTPVRVVCQNTLSAALGSEDSTELTVRHSRNAAERVKVAAAMIEQARAYFGTFHKHALALVKQRLAYATATEIAAALYPNRREGDRVITPANQTKLVELYQRQPDTTDRRVAGTKWGFFNAVTALLDHNARNTSGGKMGRTLANGQSTIRNRAMELLQAA
jgi:phage/plasmid-like protein (TIGR03299 family)